ncbi:MAG: allantoicase [Acidobacteria bacterium 13_1_20CM_3_53_8]|nr:MAG: allantoicase [Acidobacteria bacterium 13_1_20CM_3_53_8]
MEFTELVDLASERLGGAVVAANDEFFAEKENLLKPSAPVFVEGKYTDRGKWMDGWETRRRRTPGYDWCVVRLGFRGIIRGVLVDTSFFRGNYPESCSLEVCDLRGQPSVEELIADDSVWKEILSESKLQGDSQNLFEIKSEERASHLRFKIYPDGGVARLRVYGEVLPDWESIRRRGGEIDLAAVENGGRVIDCSDMFFGHRHNLIMPGRAQDMSDGWETKRRRGPGYDWVVIQLGKRGEINRVEVDTAHFKGNYPESCSLEVCDFDNESQEKLASADWREILPRVKLQAHTRHFYEDEIKRDVAATHLRFNIYPDGGVSRLRVYGRIE